MNAQTSNNPWFAATVGLGGLIAGYLFASVSIGPTTVGSLPTQQVAQASVPSAPQPSNDTPADADDDAVLGQEDAPVTIIEFTDYQCPFCARNFTQTYGQIKKEYVDTGKVKYVVRDYPLGFHPHAQKTAEATECADKQGKFWEMHDKLFETQSVWNSATDISVTLKQYAKDLGLNASDFDSCLDSGEMASEVSADQADGAAAGIDGTPGFWVLGPGGKTQKISGAVPFATFKQAFDSMLP